MSIYESRQRCGYDEKFPLPGGPIDDELIGFEVEVENLRLQDKDYIKLSEHWSDITDGSLRDGVEFVQRTPYVTRKSLSKLRELLSIISKKGRFSSRTSIHCHFDIRNLDSDGLCCFAALYWLYENLLFSTNKATSKRATENLYTPAGVSTAFVIRKIISYMPSYTFDRQACVFEMSPKYSGLSFNKILALGTAEFRGFSGDTRLNEIKRVVDTINNFKRLSYGLSLSDIDRYTEHPLESMDRLFPPHTLKEFHLRSRRIQSTDLFPLVIPVKEFVHTVIKMKG